jgi:DNA polymerase
VEAEVVFVGEAPGRTEDLQGRPLVGAAGHFFDLLLQEAGLRRDEVYITNVLKSRPTDTRDGPNRPPRLSEVAACLPWLEQQLALLRPRLVVTLGSTALRCFLPGRRLAEVHGRPIRQGHRLLLPTFHPAAAVRHARVGPGREDCAVVLRRDFRKIPRLLRGLREEARQAPAVGSRMTPPTGPRTPPPSGIRRAPTRRGPRFHGG